MSDQLNLLRFLGRVEGFLCYWKARKGDLKQTLDNIMESYEEIFPDDQEEFWEKVGELSTKRG